VKKLIWLAFMVVAASLLVGCGGSKGPSTSIDVTLTEFSFTPDEFTVPAGQEITVHTTNNGAVIHDFAIMKLGTTVGTDFDEEDQGNIYWKIQTPIGQEATGTFTAPEEPGDYQVVCGVPGHYISGMLATLHVVAP